MSGSYRAFCVWVALLCPLLLQGQGLGQGLPGNLRSRLFATAPDTLILDSLSIVPGSVQLSGWPDSLFRVLPASAKLVWLQKPAQDSVWLRYRVLPVSLQHVYARKSIRLVDSNIASLIYRQQQSGRGLVDFNKLEYAGSYGRSLSLGNNQDVSLNSHFNLQANGYLLDSIRLEAALTDNTLPFQPEGNTRQLQEFDQIFIRLSKNQHSLILGDYNLERPPAYFLNFFKRVQGAYYQGAFAGGKNKMGVSGSVAKGQFARNIFDGQEGNQGPYKLRGNNGEQFFIVLAGTERVFINGQLMERGEDADYVINYNTGEIRFMARRLITRDLRIQIEFEYQDRNYLNSLIYAWDELQISPRWRMRLDAYSNQDARNQPYMQSLDGPRKRLLSQVGDSVQHAFFPSATPDTFAAHKILYRLTDTLVNGQYFDSVFHYTTVNAGQLYNLSFSFVGPGQGDYVISGNQANGRVYEWVAPIGGQRQGSYAPVQLLIAPRMQQVFNLSNSFRIDSSRQLSWELGASNNDPNLFSDANRAAHWGMASRLVYTEDHRWGRRDSAADKRWHFSQQLSYEFVQERFKAIAPFRNVEFERDWNVPLQTYRPDEHLAEARLSLQQARLGTATYQYGYYRRGDGYSGHRNILSYAYGYRRLKTGLVFNMLQSADTAFRSVFLRPSAFAEYVLGPGGWALGGRFEAERNALRRADTLDFPANAFDMSSLYLRSAGSRPRSLHLSYRLRRDHLPRANAFVQQSHSHNADLRLSISQWRNHNLSLTTSYRQLIIDDTLFNNQRAETSLLGRLGYNGSTLGQALQLSTIYEFGSGQEQKRSYTYVEVPAGQGQYTWIDYNGDGLQQANEFETALYADQKRFIRLLSPTNDYVRVHYISLSQSLNLEPASWWRGQTVQGLRKMISRLSYQASVQIHNRLLASQGLGAFNPFISTLNDQDIILTNNIIQNTLYFNRSHPVWGIDYNLQYASGKQLLTYGVEGNRSSQQQVRLRWNLNRSLSLQLSARQGQRAYRSALEDGRTYLVRSLSGEPSLTWLHRSALRLTGSLRYEQRHNEPAYGAERATISGGSMELRWTQPRIGALQLRASYQGIDYNGQSNAPVTFVMLDGLQAGNNILWYLNWDRRLTRGLELSLAYEGRRPGAGDIIHTGRMTVRAIL